MFVVPPLIHWHKLPTLSVYQLPCCNGQSRCTLAFAHVQTLQGHLQSNGCALSHQSELSDPIETDLLFLSSRVFKLCLTIR